MTEQLGIYLPEYKAVRMNFLQQIFSGEKLALEKEKIRLA